MAMTSRIAAWLLAPALLGLPEPAAAQANAPAPRSNPPGPNGYLPESLPERIPGEALLAGRPFIERLWGFIGRDYSKKDLSALSREFMAHQAFDQETKWPSGERLPALFDPKAWLEEAKDPGLGLARLHAAGVTGAGVSVAIIDKPIRASHAELAGRIVYTEVFGGAAWPRPPHFHGHACASILAGKTCGVAPEARLFYFAVPDDGKNFLNYSRAVDVLIAANAKLPSAESIRIVSISDGGAGASGKEWRAARRKLAEAGIALIFSSGDVLSGFAYGGCPPYLDRDDPSNYSRSSNFREPAKGKVLIPADFRTTASNAGDGTYVYWGDGGYSWAMLYAAGLAALAWQIRPDLS